MGKEWSKFPRISNEYIKGVESFLDFAYTRGRPQGHVQPSTLVVHET